MDKDLSKVLSQLTLEEKAGLCSGQDFWHLKGIERLDMPSIMVADGPHGLRKQAEDSDHMGLNKSIEATCFPTASATASSWDEALMTRMGVALAEECLSENISVLLGPGANIKRSPLCGRNFEYVSEDPYLSGQLATAFVKGVQSKGVGTSLKHFVANNQEYRRMTIDALIDERAFRELYLASFENVIKEAQPWTVMCAYNKINGRYASDHQVILNDILKEEWGHTGLVVTDWGACNDRVEGIRAGMTLEMPSSDGFNDRKIVAAVKEGRLSLKALDSAVLRVLDLISKSEAQLNSGQTYDKEAHHRLARELAAKSAVLLKNEGSVLPLATNQSVAVIGAFAKMPRYQGAGSSLINPTQIGTTLGELDQRGLTYAYAPGYDVETDKIDQKLIDEALEVAKEVEVVLIFVGLTDAYESEGFDRSHMRMPSNHNALVEALTSLEAKVVVVLQNGAPVEMPWVNEVDGILESYLGGQAVGQATVDLLYGDANPGGRLAETFPVKLEDDLASKWFGMGPKTIEYRESIFVGYRYYDTAKKKVQFPFGHGLSYTDFTYRDLRVSCHSIKDSERVVVAFKVKNSGDCSGSDVAQVYIKDIKSTIYRPEKELKAYKKVYLEPGEEVEVRLELDKRAFAYYNVNIKDWHVESGDFQILIGRSSLDIKLDQVIEVLSTVQASVPDYRVSAPAYYALDKVEGEIDSSDFEEILGRSLPENKKEVKGDFNINSTMEDLKVTFVGKQLYKLIYGQMMKMMGDPSDAHNRKQVRMMEHVVNDMPIRAMLLLGGGKMTEKMMQSLLAMMNGHPVKAIVKLITGRN